MLFTLPYKNQLKEPFKRFIKAGILQETLLDYKIRNGEREIAVKIEMDSRAVEGNKIFPLYIITTTDEDTIQKFPFSPKQFNLMWQRLSDFAEHGDNSKLPNCYY